MKTLNITALEWFDKLNGNSYFAAKIEIDKNLNTERSLVLPFQYGYGNQYEYIALKELQGVGVISKDFDGTLSRYCSDKSIAYNSIKKLNCAKKELKNLK